MTIRTDAEKKLAQEALNAIGHALDQCEDDGPVFQALEECRYKLEDIRDEADTE